MKAEQIKKALDRLADPKVNERVLWLHDFHEKCYREKENYTRNGLHWGYAEGIVCSITGEQVAGNTGTTYAFFEDDGIERSMDNIRAGRRFSKHSYAEVRGIIEKTLHEDLETAVRAEAEKAALRNEWAQIIKRDCPLYAGRTMRLETTPKDNLRVLVIKPERLILRGFGRFLEDIQPGEISCSSTALEWLRRGKERRGLRGMEVFATPVIAGMFSLDTAFEPGEVSVAVGAVDKLLPLMVIEDPGLAPAEVPAPDVIDVTCVEVLPISGKGSDEREQYRRSLAAGMLKELSVSDARLEPGRYKITITRLPK
jgi:hypothetical protein